MSCRSLACCRLGVFRDAQSDWALRSLETGSMPWALCFLEQLLACWERLLLLESVVAMKGCAGFPTIVQSITHMNVRIKDLPAQHWIVMAHYLLHLSVELLYTDSKK